MVRVYRACAAMSKYASDNEPPGGQGPGLWPLLPHPLTGPVYVVFVDIWTHMDTRIFFVKCLHPT